MQLEAKLKSLETTEDAKPLDSPPGRGFRAVCRRMVAQGLLHTGLMRAIERLAGSYDVHAEEGSALPRVRATAGSKFGILCYHRVGTQGVPLFSRLEPSAFAAQMRYVKKHYRVVPLGQLCDELQDGRRVPPTLAITFDDGYRDLYTHAFPVLQKYQIPATIYLIGRCMESGEVPWYDRIFLALKAAPGESLKVELGGAKEFRIGSPSGRVSAAWEMVSYLRRLPNTRRQEWCAAFERQFPLPVEELEGRMLDWNQVGTMHRAGISFGAHTMSHPVVSQLDPRALEEELVVSKKVLERGLGARVEDFAYPFGKPEDGSVAAEGILRRAAYRSAVTTIQGFNTTGSDRLRLRRLQIAEDTALANFAFNVSRLFLEVSRDKCSVLHRSESVERPGMEMRRF
jgi:peptidoglycan/xylan/chitin deacetylase (PgdA/CDA1 family)